MDFKKLLYELISALKKYRSVMIYIKGSPDPDVIASSFSLKLICSNIGVKAAIIGSTKPSLPQNSAMINELDIPIRFEESIIDVSDYDAYCVLDFQSAGISGISGKLPCAVHIDHHEPVEEDIKIDFNLVIEEINAVSSFFALLLREMTMQSSVLSSGNNSGITIDSPQFKRACTALQLGIYTDTDGYRHAENVDFEALNFVSDYSDKKIIFRIVDVPLPRHVQDFLIRAFKNREEYKEWIFSGIGFIEESMRDSIAIVADYLIQRYKCPVVVVFAVVIKKKPHGLRLDASFRTDDEKINLDMLIKEITQSGGGRKYKGAYQVDLDYFINYPDREILWKIIKDTTISNLKKLRDEFQIIEIKGFYKKMRKKIFKV
jgi:nanoRNase/pAp phosphatase (c-di-AMP/oligoRNAs hydrolase)